MNKRGQFYIIAAIIVILAISGIISVATYAVAKPSPKTIYDLSDDLKKEGTRIVDYGIYSQEHIVKLLHNFTDKEFAPYFLSKTENANILFVYGNGTELYGVRYDTVSTGRVTASIGGASTNWYQAGIFANRTLIQNIGPGDTIQVTMLGKTFNFEIKDNEMFYFVMLQEKEEEIYVEIKGR
jgi:hypothetical protein